MSLTQLIIDLYNMIMIYFDDLTILGVATSIQARNFIRLLGRDYWCLQYNHAGTITVTIDKQPPQEVQGPSLLLTSPGHDYVFGSPDGWHHNYVAFTGPRVKRYVRTNLLPVQEPLWQIQDSHAFLTQLTACAAAYRRRDTASAAHGLEALLLQIHRQTHVVNKPSHHLDVRQLVDHMRNEPEKNWDLAEQAVRLHLSLVHLRRLMKEITGQAPGQFLLQCRLVIAADRLMGTLLPIKQIAAESGIGDVHYFSRVFRKKYHCPPGYYRSQFLGDIGDK